MRDTFKTRRRRAVTLAAALALAVAAFVSGCSGSGEWIVFRGDGGRGHTSNAMTPPLGIRWKLQLQEEGNRAFAFNNLIIKDDVSYFGSTDGNFYAMDLETGYMKWVFRTDGPVNSVPTVDEQHVYFGSNDGYLYAVNRETGEEAWRFFTRSTVQSTVVRHEDYVITSSDGVGTFFLSPDGELLYEIVNPVWHRDQFQIFDETLYFAAGPPSNLRALGAFDIRTKSYDWLLPSEIMTATWYSFPAATERHVFMATSRYNRDHLTFRHYGLDRETGQIRWVHEAVSQFGQDPPEHLYLYFRDLLRILDYQAPAVWRDRVIVTGGDTVVRALSASDGSTLWERIFSRRTSSAPLIAGDHVFVGIRGDEAYYELAAEGEPRRPGSPARTGPRAIPVVEEEDAGIRPQPPRLVALSARTGRIIWELETDGAVLSPPVVAGRWMMFGTDRNFVYVLERLLG